jgi:hypothetical protein
MCMRVDKKEGGSREFFQVVCLDMYTQSNAVFILDLLVFAEKRLLACQWVRASELAH